MSRNYSPKTFLRKTPNSILKEYFKKKNPLTDINFDSLGETEIEPITQALDKLLQGQRKEVEVEFQRINEMAYEDGVRVLLEEAGSVFHNLDWSGTFAQMKNPYEHVFWAFLNHRTIFDIASDLARMDRVSSWRRRYVGEGLSPAIKPGDLENLAKALIGYYKNQGRGEHCKVDNYLRQEPERHCYFTYPEDYGTTDMVYDEKGEFRLLTKRPAVEVIFVYKPDTGVLETNARGKKEEIEKLL
jgi:hypothetical protein